jgi:antitoxin HigA-1
MGMSAMCDPPHPGEILADTVLRADGGITVTAFAEKLKMTRAAISRVVNGKAGISPELSLRLEEALGTSAESWLAMQSAYDLSQAKKAHRVKVKRIHMEDTEVA